MADRIVVGKFKNTSGKLRVSDPCYDKSTWCAGLVENCKVGEWEASVVKIDSGSWGMRVANLYVRAVDGVPSGVKSKVDFEVGVDAGMAGVFDDLFYGKQLSTPIACEGDKEYARGYHLHAISSIENLIKDPLTSEAMVAHFNKEIDSRKRELEAFDMQPAPFTSDFFEAVCSLTIGNLGAGVIEYGAVSRSGFGDGSYSAYITKNAEGEVVEIEIDYGVYEPTQQEEELT